MSVGADTTLTAVPAMGHETLREARALIESPAVHAVSTDVFDTLLWRRVADPADAFEVVGQRLAARGMLANALTPGSFSALRRQAERAVRARFLDEHGSTEIRLAEIYEAIPDWVFAGGSREAAMEEELGTELDLVVPDLDVLGLLAAADERGKTLVAVSDTYLSADQLRRLLGQAVLARLTFRHLLTSSDHRDNKSGGLFDVAVGALGVAPEQFLHLGDHPEADIAAAARRGIRTVHLERRSPALQELLWAEGSFRGPAAPLAAKRTELERPAGADFGLAALRAKMEHRAELAEAPSALRPFWRFGAHVYGPVLTGFAEWVHERARSAGAERVFCLMREGGSLAELIRAGAAGVEEPVAAEVMWLNRDVCSRAAIGSATREELEVFLYRRTPPTLAELCRTLGVAVNDLGDLAAHADTRLEDPIIRSLVLDALTAEGLVRDGIVARARALRERLVRSVEAACGDDDPIVLVDLGWGATIQQRLMAAFEQAGRPRRVVGLYLVTHEGAAAAVSRGAEVHGFLVNLGTPPNVAATIMRSPEILEQSLMPAHGTQLDIDEDLRPVLETGGPRSLQDVEAESVRRGALAFQREYLRYQLELPGKLSRLAAGSDALAAILMRSIAAPTAAEASLFAAWLHDENLGSELSHSMVEASWDERVRHLSPQQLTALPMNELYWPWGLARARDPKLAELATAATAGLISWEATATPLESGKLTIEAVGGVGVEGSPRHEAVPTRNRHGLSFVTHTLKAGAIERVQIRFGERPLVVRLDWLTLRAWIQGEAEPRVVRMDGPGAFAQLDRLNVLALAPNLLVATTEQPIVSFALARLTERVVFRVDVELAFAALRSGPLLPGPGSPLSLASADRQLEQMRRSVSWRVTRPLRAAKRRLRPG